MAKARNLWPESMDIWVVTGALSSGKTRVASALIEAARQHGLVGEMVDDVRTHQQVEGLLRMRTSAPDMLIIVTEKADLSLPRKPRHTLHINPEDAGKAEQLAAQIWSRRAPAATTQESAQ